ncbi:MAG: ESX-1 secretion-associated protein [Mycobacteriaceae bacterium]|nr:ESX-1 secretion-associated protein [Mycobacteriaceae bacterium]
MADVTVTPAYLVALAAQQEKVAAQAAQASAATTHIKKETEKTWGPFRQMVNDAFAGAEAERNQAINRVALRRSVDAANLHAAAQLYAKTDAHLGEQLANQMLGQRSPSNFRRS